MKIDLKKMLTAAFLGLASTTLVACSSDITMNRKTGVVEIEGIAANDLVDMLGLENTFEVNVDPETGAVAINGTPVNKLLKENYGGENGKDREPDEGSGEDSESGKSEVTDQEEKDEPDDKEAEETSESDTMDKFEECGVTIDFADAYDGKLGCFEPAGGEIGYDADIFAVETAYVGVSHEWMDRLTNENVTDEDLEKIESSTVRMPSIIAAGKKMSLKELVERANDKYEYELDEKYFEDLGESDNYRFYKYYDPEQKTIDDLDPDFREEYDELLKIVNKAIDSAELYDPVDMFEGVVGKKLEFTTTDLDGKKMTSDELFGDNEVTMLNVWASWCGPCKDELPELEKINKRLNKQNGAVIGLLSDGDDDDAIESAKQTISDTKVTYQMIKPWEGALENDLIIPCWPVTYFVDSEGVILCKPVMGEDFKAYDIVLDKLLNKEDTDDKMDADDKKDTDDKEDTDDKKDADGETSDRPLVTANGLKLYRVYVTDADDRPVKGAMIQLCDDSSCRVEKTDENGMASFETDKNDYDVHVLKVPEGYKKYNASHKFNPEYADMHIVLEKE